MGCLRHRSASPSTFAVQLQFVSSSLRDPRRPTHCPDDADRSPPTAQTFIPDDVVQFVSSSLRDPRWPAYCPNDQYNTRSRTASPFQVLPLLHADVADQRPTTPSPFPDLSQSHGIFQI
ncbi:unnamed protein product [Citrullus colocynthis]|uniref:Uncharacterized protein n=1 Tax=Citrullus colocynthis TaxID=252529 RepID=A0ABP0Z604_9ROSI